MASIYILFYWFFCLILYHTAGCGGSLALCLCLSGYLGVFTIIAPRSKGRASLSKLIIIFHNTCCTICHSHRHFVVFLRSHMKMYQQKYKKNVISVIYGGKCKV